MQYDSHTPPAARNGELSGSGRNSSSSTRTIHGQTGKPPHQPGDLQYHYPSRQKRNGGVCLSATLPRPVRQSCRQERRWRSPDRADSMRCARLQYMNISGPTQFSSSKMSCRVGGVRNARFLDHPFTRYYRRQLVPMHWPISLADCRRPPISPCGGWPSMIGRWRTFRTRRRSTGSITLCFAPVTAALTRRRVAILNPSCSRAATGRNEMARVAKPDVAAVPSALANLADMAVRNTSSCLATVLPPVRRQRRISC